MSAPMHELVMPQGYFLAASGDTLPWFDGEGRAIVLLCWPDGSVTWQLRSRDGEVLGPDAVDDSDITGAEVAAMLRDGGPADDSDIMPGSEFDGPVVL